MNALRLVLLAAGILLIATLAWRGRRRSSQVASRGVDEGGGSRAETESVAGEREFSLPRMDLEPRSARTDLPLPVVRMGGTSLDDDEESPETRERDAAHASFDEDARATAVLPRSDDRVEPVEASAEGLNASLLGSTGVDFGGLSTTIAAGTEIRIDWPAESARRIFSLRVVPRIRDRLSGRELRLALEAQGMRHGPLGIYHLPSAAGVSLMCAASLAKPGMLDPQQIDFQSFSGVNLFIVLPGPESAAEMVDRLILVARELCQRVDGRLQDDSGAQLGAMRLAELRDQLLVGDHAADHLGAD